MSFLLLPEEAPGRGLARVIGEQARKLIEECEAAEADEAAFVHKARVRCKKIRATLRLARPMMRDRDYKRENRWWRDAARGVSSVRDLSARIEALDALKEHLVETAGESAVTALAGRFENQRADSKAEEGAVARFCKLVKERDPFEASRIAVGSKDDLGEALQISYAAARKAMAHALAEETPELAHEWRKQTKYHSLQRRLTRKLLADALQADVGEARDLAERLGLVQDIEVVMQALERRDDPKLRKALEGKRKALMFEARVQGGHLFGLKPKRWAEQLVFRAPVTA